MNLKKVVLFSMVLMAFTNIFSDGKGEWRRGDGKGHHGQRGHHGHHGKGFTQGQPVGKEMTLATATEPQGERHEHGHHHGKGHQHGHRHHYSPKIDQLRADFDSLKARVDELAARIANAGW